MPMLLEVGDVPSECREAKVLYFLRSVADCHLVKYNAVGPHIDGGCDPGLVGHLWSLVVWCADYSLKVSALLAGGLMLVPIRHYIAETEVDNLSQGQFIFLLLLFLAVFTFSLGLYEDIVDLDVGVDDASLMHVPDG